jgi:hypothetical protein
MHNKKNKKLQEDQSVDNVLPEELVREQLDLLEKVRSLRKRIDDKIIAIEIHTNENK